MGAQMCSNIRVSSKLIIFAMLLAGSMVPSHAFSQSSQDKEGSAVPARKRPETALPRRYAQNRLAAKALRYYSLVWGVDSLSVKSVESGEIIRFTYRVVDADKAKPLNDKRNEPSLIDPGAGVKLAVPSLEKIGKLRQTSTPLAGKVYWMAFSNRGGHVKPGHHVDVVIGQFHAAGLVVQ
jgi:hypothetical protein